MNIHTDIQIDRHADRQTDVQIRIIKNRKEEYIVILCMNCMHILNPKFK
jgi:hypothetical protein